MIFHQKNKDNTEQPTQYQLKGLPETLNELICHLSIVFFHTLAFFFYNYLSIMH